MKVKSISKTKSVVSFLLGILMMFSLMVTLLSFFIKFIMFNPDTYLKILDKKSTHEQIYDNLYGNIGYALTVNNISTDVKDGIITIEELKQEVDSVIGGTVKYLQTGINNVEYVNVEKYVERFDNNLKIFLRDNAIHIDNSLQVQIEELESDVRQIIKNELEMINIDVLNEYEVIAKVASLTSLFVNKLYWLSLIIPVFLIIVLLVIWRRDYIRAMQWIGNGFISAGLFVAVIFFSGYVSKFYNNIIIDTIYLREFIASVLKKYLGTLTIWGMFVVVVGLLLLIPQIDEAIKRSKMRRKPVSID